MAFLAPPTWLENATNHSAVDYRVALASSIGPGLSGVAASADLKVTEKSGTANMSVDVAGGGVFVASTRSAAQGTYHAYSTATINVAIAASDPTNPRIDRILVQIRDQAQDAALTQNDARILVVQGTPAATPAAPTITVQDYTELARVTVPAAATAISNANISDQRVASPAWSQPRGVIAVLRSTAGESLSTSVGPETAPSLSLSNVTIPAGRRIRTSLSGAFGITGTGPVMLTAEVYQSGVATGVMVRHKMATNDTEAGSAFTVQSLAAGTYDYTVRLTQDGAVTKRVRGDVAAVTLLIEDVGGVLA